MEYYDDEYEESYDNYEEHIEPVSLIAEECTEMDITKALLEMGLILDKNPRLSCSMEKLVYVYGHPSEVYSAEEIRFTERVEKVLVYPDFSKRLNKGNMACRVIAVKFNCSGRDALRECVSFEKIIDKALDGFNVFFFVTEESIFFGCRIFDKDAKHDCTISSPIKSEIEFEQLQEELSFLAEMDDFMDFYNQYKRAILSNTFNVDDYEDTLMKRRGLQFSYLDEIDKLGRDIGIDMSRETERYWHLFEKEPEVSFSALLEEVEDSLSFIKSNRVNTYEMLFEADEMMRFADETEAENNKLAQQASGENTHGNSQDDKDVEALLYNPEEMIKLLKKRRGL